jgi:hypothetical protein
MKRHLALLFVLIPLAAGCATGAPSADAVRSEIERRVPEARFELEEHVRLGPISMGLLHGLVRMAPGKADGQDFFTSIRRVDVATYRVKSLPDLDHLDAPAGFENNLARAGWTLAVRTREADERTWVFLHATPDGALRNLFVVSLDPKELTIARVDGRLDRAFAEAMAEHPRQVAQKLGGD